MDDFYPLEADASGYAAIPESSYDLIILNHVIEHMPDAETILGILCTKLKPGGFIWIAFPSPRSLGMPSATGTLQFCDDDTHVHVPDIREVSNILLANGTKIVHAGRSRDFVRTLVGAVVLPRELMRKLITGRFMAHGLWYLFGFEDHVFGQRKIQQTALASS